MCRWLAYAGVPTHPCRLVTEAEHSLVAQSLNARESRHGATNGDGFGLGWYGERPEPGLYRDILPAWSDENLRHLCRMIRTRLFFAHVRASTGTATSRANCHPFSHGRWMFMHNGQIGGYAAIRRGLEALLPDALYECRKGSTDSELIFLIGCHLGLDSHPVEAMSAALARVETAMARAGVDEPLRFTAALTDGRRLYAFRHASDDAAPSLYWRADEDGVVVVSEPLDQFRARWQPVPPESILVAEDGTVRVESLMLEAAA